VKASRIALWVYYLGHRFRGYQAQVEGNTVQQALESALARLGVERALFASGRTDRGVHARMQVVSFRVDRGESPDSLAAALAPLLPEGLGIAAAARADASFHAQWSAQGKEYRYRLALGPVDPAWSPYVWEPGTHERLEGRAIDLDLLARTLARCVGAHDFIAFHEKSSVQKRRTLDRCELRALGGGLREVRISGEGFGRYQVRLLVGTAMLVAAGALDEAAFARALESGEAIAGLRAPAQGLVLWQVRYPDALDPFRGVTPGVPDLPPFRESA
jgi:tRNA pseudouridine38-40 synthase